MIIMNAENEIVEEKIVTSEPVEVEDGILFMGKKFPKELKWVFVLMKLKQRGYLLRYYWDIPGEGVKTSYYLSEWEMDRDTGDITPRMPDKVEVLEPDRFSGRLRVVKTIRMSRTFDPPLDQIDMLMNMNL